ncbi:hypothetical protein SAMN05878482_101696 [Peribacillus simplex]|uniref:Uncharacterized protein n=1 Tax=Peribacillus simplex TaxID=1478 RepID=A0A9X8WHQ6_9BACI|nr:hypothetical protein SAMN05878482_101696 [Peribacillus simplex]
MIRRYIFPILLISWAMVIFFFSSQTYEEQSITPFLAQFNTPYWYDKLMDGAGALSPFLCECGRTASKINRWPNSLVAGYHA